MHRDESQLRSLPAGIPGHAMDQARTEIDLHRRMLQARPTDVRVLMALAQALLRCGEAAEAGDVARRAVQVEPDAAEGWMLLGAALAREQRFADGAAALRRAVALSPDSAAAHINLGNCLRRSGALEHALVHYRRGVELAPGSPQAAFNLANALADARDPVGAETAFRAALDLQPGYHAARSNLGNLLLAEHRYEQALACFRAVAAADAAFARVHYNIGVALQGLGRDIEAVAAYRRALQADPRDHEACNNLCIALLRVGRPQDALDVCDLHLRLAPPSRKALAYRAAALLDLGRRGEAGALLDFDRLLLRRIVSSPSGFDSTHAFNQALAAYVQAHPTLTYEPTDKSTRGGSQTGELLDRATPLTAALRDLIASAVEAFAEHARKLLPAHPFTRSLPTRWRLATWGVVLQEQGHQGAHFHPSGCISGVYYVRLPVLREAAPAQAGCIEFGRTADAIGGTAPPLVETVCPQEGLMLLFPSYFYHRTVPFSGEGPRISIAFDVIPEF